MDHLRRRRPSLVLPFGSSLPNFERYSEDSLVGDGALGTSTIAERKSDRPKPEKMNWALPPLKTRTEEPKTSRYKSFIPMRDLFKKVTSMLKGTFSEIKLTDLSPDDVIIILIGLTGAGKSSFISKLVGGTTGVGEGLEGCTSSVNVVRLQHLERSTHNIAFVDTPGFDDTYKSDDEITDMINDWVAKNLPKGKLRPSGVLYLHRITDNRMTQSSKRSLGKLRELFGEENIIFVTTMWDAEKEVDEAEQSKNERKLKSTWRDVVNGDPTVIRYDNNEHSAWNVINSIIEARNKEFEEELRSELIEMRGRLGHTNAGRNVYTALENFISSQQKTLNELRERVKNQGIDKSEVMHLKNKYEECQLASEDMLQFLGGLIPVPKHLHRFSVMKSNTTVVSAN